MKRSAPVWLSPDAPTDQRPTPLDGKPLTSLGVTAGIAKKLGAAGIRTVADLRAYEAEGKDITEIKGVGFGSAQTIHKALAAWESGQ